MCCNWEWRERERERERENRLLTHAFPFTYSLTHQACAKAGQSGHALRLMEEMVARKGLTPDIVAYSAAMSACLPVVCMSNCVYSSFHDRKPACLWMNGRVEKVGEWWVLIYAWLLAQLSTHPTTPHFPFCQLADALAPARRCLMVL